MVHQAARVARRVVRTKETRLEELYRAVGNHKHRQRWQQVVGTKTIIINSNNINRPIAVAVNIRRTRTTPAAEVVVVMEEITTATTTTDIIIATTATTMVIPSAVVTRGGAQNASEWMLILARRLLSTLRSLPARLPHVLRTLLRLPNVTATNSTTRTPSHSPPSSMTSSKNSPWNTERATILATPLPQTTTRCKRSGRRKS